MVAYTWISRCGRQHDNLPTCWTCGPPAALQEIPAEEFAARVEINDDVCLIDEKHWFIRGQIEIPIVDAAERLAFSVWTALSDASMERILETWDDADRASQPSYFGWLATELAPFPGSLNLAMAVQNRPPGCVPLVFVAPTDHPLSKAQREGVTLQRVVEIAETLMTSD